MYCEQSVTKPASRTGSSTRPHPAAGGRQALGSRDLAASSGRRFPDGPRLIPSLPSSLDQMAYSHQGHPICPARIHYTLCPLWYGA